MIGDYVQQPCRGRPLTPALSPDAGGEGAFLPLPLAGRGEGYSVTISAVLSFIANQVPPRASAGQKRSPGP